MNYPEKIAGAYLRLNGFFLLPHFTLFDGASHTHVDFLVLRPPKGREKVNNTELPLDEELFIKIDELCKKKSKDLLLGGVVEVRGNEDKDIPEESHLTYARHFLGPTTEVVSFSFFRNDRDIEIEEHTITIPVAHVLKWVKKRIVWMDQHANSLTKSGSWPWSEGVLSDLLYQHQLDPTFLGRTETAKRTSDEVKKL